MQPLHEITQPRVETLLFFLMLKIEYTIFIILQYTIKMSIQDALIKFDYKEPTVDLRCIDNRSDFFLGKK